MSKFYDIILYDPYTDIPLVGLMDTNIYNHKICNEWIDKISDNLIVAENEEMIVYHLKKRTQYFVLPVLLFISKLNPGHYDIWTVDKDTKVNVNANDLYITCNVCNLSYTMIWKQDEMLTARFDNIPNIQFEL